MTKQEIIEVYANHHKLACIPANTKVTSQWLEQINDADIHFIGYIGLAGVYVDNSYAVFEIPESMTEEEFHTAISLESNSFILTPTGISSWSL